MSRVDLFVPFSMIAMATAGAWAPAAVAAPLAPTLAPTLALADDVPLGCEAALPFLVPGLQQGDDADLSRP